ncbi:MAG: NAD(+) synthase [Planctomycetaceae bacterium]|nr:NAD(+) synthase [Planctomycetaceae bacterium]
MKLIKVAAGIVNTTPLDWDGNKAAILGAIEAARADGAQILCLPEMCLCGYGCEDAFASPGLRRMARQVLQEILPATRGIIVSLGLPVLYHNALFNTACLVADGNVLGFVAKQHLAGEGLHYEPRWFKPWPAGVAAEVELDGRTYRMGDLFFDIGGVRIGFEICEDAWVAKRPGGDLAQHGVDIILNPSASHFAFGKIAVRKRFVLEGSRAFGCTYVYSNLLGNEAGRAIYDGGALIATGGAMAAAGPRFGFESFAVTSAVVDIDATRLAQSRTGSFTPAAGDGACIRAPFDYAAGPLCRPAADQPGWEYGPSVQEEEFTRAMTLGLFDYLRKSRSRGFVVSLSGGADSSLVTCLVAMMVRRACAALGVEAFKKRLGYFGLQGSSEQQIVRALLTCVYQSTANSSDTTRSAARQVAEAVGAEFIELDVDPFFKGYVAAVEGALGRRLAWQSDDIALQNIQARVRAPGVWMIANLRSALLLATSNRSEAAVGYATMDGDTCGGLSPIAGIDKAFIRRYLRWLEAAGPHGLGPIPQLHAVNVQQPTAELRPSEQAQTDEADLMPYDLLDAIERAAIRDKKTPVEVFELMLAEFPQHGRGQLAAWIDRFFRLWCRNQWKRERYAPSFHLDDKNLDPKTWCRFPILSGGFERELAELRQRVSVMTTEAAPSSLSTQGRSAAQQPVSPSNMPHMP